MLKKNITLLAICLALFIATNAVAKINTNPLSSPSPGMPLTEGAPRTVRVRLMAVETNADIVDWPYPGLEIIIKAGAAGFNKKTGENGVVFFDAVPCGEQIVITVKGEEGGEDSVFHRRLTCTRSQVDLGIIERSFGGGYTLKQRKLQPMGFDAAKNVWRNADGKIISMRTFNRIMAQRH
jgi:hypothetical protein